MECTVWAKFDELQIKITLHNLVFSLNNFQQSNWNFSRDNVISSFSSFLKEEKEEI